MAMLYGDIQIITSRGPYTVRARLLTGTLSDGTEIRVGCDRRELAWTFTDIASGGKLASFPDYLLTKAITKFDRKMSGISPQAYAAATAKLYNEMGGLESPRARSEAAG